ncbi:MAG: 4-(cytidine 5'-diphospho)-2-C-methyl-D-erythritol kinase [Planctomycetota bacterium]
MDGQSSSRDPRGELSFDSERAEFKSIQCPGKLNLFLEVGAKRKDGYHEIETIMATIGLADTLYFRSRPSGDLTLRVDYFAGMTATGMPVAEENLVFRVVDGFRKATGCQLGGDLLLEKRVPLQAGLGGASSDAANALRLANRLWEIGWSDQQLSEFAAGYGSDLPFFLADGWAVCRGRGENVVRLGRGLECPVVLVQPPVGFSTAEIYRLHRPPEQLRSPSPMLDAISAGRVSQIAACLFNRLELAAVEVGPWVERLQGLFRMLPVLGHQMTGSGSCYFGMFPNRLVARRSAAKLQAALPDCRVMVSELLPNG